MNDPKLKAYVVTAERAARRYEEMGVRKPYVVIPQGVSVSTLAQGVRERAGNAWKEGEVIVGWMAAHLLTRADRDGANTLYNIDHLLELWDGARTGAERAAWLIGGASPESSNGSPDARTSSCSDGCPASRRSPQLRTSTCRLRA